MRTVDPVRRLGRRLLLRRLRDTYSAVLRREPAARELIGRSVRTVTRGGWPNLLRDMIESEEFRMHILPGLVATRTEMRAPNPVFFLHIPKTGGTSIRTTLGEAIGVPALNLYPRWPTPDRMVHHFWPYWAGHAQVDFFPSSHVGFTVLREPRSRVLSDFRHQHFLRSTRVTPHGWDHPTPERPPSPMPPFKDWLRRSHERVNLSIIRFFLPASSPTPPKFPSPDDVRRQLAEPEARTMTALYDRLGRFHAAAWLHDTDAVLRAITDVTGNTVDGLPRMNVGDENTPDPEPVTLDDEARTVLDEVSRLDALVFRVAEERGLIPALDPDRADAQFASTAERLGFRL